MIRKLSLVPFIVTGSLALCYKCDFLGFKNVFVATRSVEIVQKRLSWTSCRKQSLCMKMFCAKNGLEHELALCITARNCFVDTRIFVIFLSFFSGGRHFEVLKLRFLT